MEVKLIKFHRDQDWGQDYYLQVLFTKQWALFQGSVSWGKYPGWPFLQIKLGDPIGMGGLISILFLAHKLGISVGFFERTWKLTDFDSADGVL